MQNSDLKKSFLGSKIGGIFLNFFSVKNTGLGDKLLMKIFEMFDFWNVWQWHDIEGVTKNLRMINGCFMTTSGHFFSNYINIFHKTEVQTVIVMCLTGRNLNWFKSYDTKCQYIFPFLFFFRFCTKTLICIFCVFAFCVITIVPSNI